MTDKFHAECGRRAVLVAVFANAFLTVLNIFVGLACGSSALVSEGAHTLSDIVTTIIAYAGFQYSQKPADRQHPMGYVRAEAVSGIIIVLFLTVVAWEIVEKAVKEILFHHISVPDMYVAAMAFVGIIVNLIVSKYVISVGKQIKSPAIIADGKHQRADIFTSAAIVIGVIVSNMGFPILDPIIAVLIGILIFKVAVEIFIANVNFIIGKLPSEDFIEDIESVAKSVSQVMNVCEINVNYMGFSSRVSLRIELEEDMTLKDSHKIALEVENTIIQEIPEIEYVIVHASPIGEECSHD